MKIYNPQVTNEHKCLIPKGNAAIHVEFNQRSMVGRWGVPEFEFQSFSRRDIKTPDISDFNGGLVFRAQLKDFLFPQPLENFEFLPILVSGEPWFALNCLNATQNFDEEDSIFYRGSTGQIFSIRYLVSGDAALVDSEIFVLDGSNRTILFVLPAFINRVVQLGLEGVNFKEIGELRNI